MSARTSRADAAATRRRTLFWMTLILLLGAGLRFFQLNEVPLRGDEAFTVLHWMREPLGQTLSGIATIDPQPPLAYALYRGFGLTIGSSESLVRVLPALLNLLGVAAMYGVGKRIGGRNAGIIAAALFAASPVILWHAQDARNYGLWIAFSALALWLALRAFERGRFVDWALFVIVQVAACYLYYLELLFLAALTVYVLTLIRKSPRTVLRWFIALGVIGVALTPWFVQERLWTGGGYTGTAGGFDLSQYVTAFAPRLLFGEAIPAGRELWFIAAALMTVVAGFVLLWRQQRRYVVLLALYAGLPLIAIGLLSTRLNVFVPRYVLSVSLVWIVLAAIIIARGLSASNRSAPLRLLAIALPVLIGWSLVSYFFDYTKSPDWRALVAYLAPRTSAEDLLINSAADMAFPFYAGAYGVEGELAQLPANPGQSRAEIEGILATALEANRTIWIVAQPPAWPNQMIPDDWLRENGLLVHQVSLNGMRAEAYVSPVAAEVATLAGFGPVRLLNVDVPAIPEPDGSLPVILDFEAVSPTTQPLKTFIHVIGPINPATGTPLWAQDDQIPQDALDTRQWQPGLHYRDRFVLTDLYSLPPGDYQIVIGWYDPVTNERLQTANGDSIVIASIVVAENQNVTIRNLTP